MKLLRFTPILLVGVLTACPPAPPTPPAPPPPTSTLSVDPNAKVLAKDEVSTVEADRMLVSDASLKTGDVIVTDYADGVLRKVVAPPTPAPASVGLSPQGIQKVYVQTAEASLEDVFDSGEATVPFGAVNFDPPATLTAQGVRAEAVTGNIDIKNVTIPLPSNVGNVVFNGSIQQKLDPTFKLTFAGGKVDQFEIGLSGTFSATLKAKLSANAKFTGVGVSQTIASTTIRRFFLLSGVPVVIVIEPRLILGLTGGASDNVTVEAGINPTLSGGFKVAYNAKNTTKWTTTWNPPTFNLNPSFSYSVPSTANGEAYGKLVMDIKFYGLAGPTIETKPYLGLNLNPNGTATTKAGLATSGSLSAGINVLGKSMQLATSPLTQDASATYTCTDVSKACK